MKKVLAALVIGALLALTGAAQAAEPKQAQPQVAEQGYIAALRVQPQGAKRYFTPFEVHMLLTYRLADLTRVDFLEFAGGGCGPR